jgi:hypothetical protein
MPRRVHCEVTKIMNFVSEVIVDGKVHIQVGGSKIITSRWKLAIQSSFIEISCS